MRNNGSSCGGVRGWCGRYCLYSHPRRRSVQCAQQVWLSDRWVTHPLRLLHFQTYKSCLSYCLSIYTNQLNAWTCLYLVDFLNGNHNLALLVLSLDWIQILFEFALQVNFEFKVNLCTFDKSHRINILESHPLLPATFLI